MSAKPAAAEIGAEALGDGMHGKAAGVGGDDGSGLADGIDLAQQGAFEVEILDHGFDDPVALGEQRKMILEVSGGDQAGKARLHEGRGLGLADRIQAGFGNAVADGGRRIGGGVRRNDIEQVGTHPGVGQVRGDAGTHGSRAEDGNFLNSFQHR